MQLIVLPQLETLCKIILRKMEGLIFSNLPIYQVEISQWLFLFISRLFSKKLSLYEYKQNKEKETKSVYHMELMK